jgi:hypothetical protein
VAETLSNLSLRIVLRAFQRAFLCVPLSILPTLTIAQDLHAQDDQPAVQDEVIDTPYRWIERGFRAGLYGGYVFTNRGMLNMGPGPSPIVGTRLRIRVSSPLSLVLNFGYAWNSNLYLVDPRTPEYPAAVDTVGVTWAILQAGLQFSFTGDRTWHGWQPYLLLEGGLFFGLSQQPTRKLDIPTTPFLFRIGTQPVFDFGLGVERQMGKVGVAFEIRSHLWRIRAPDGFFRPDILLDLAERGLPVAESSDWTLNFEFSLGFYYYF